MALTPVKGKKALPSSTSIIFPQEPNCQHDWHILLEHVKSCFLRGHWKECVSQCQHLLSAVRNPVSRLMAPSKPKSSSDFSSKPDGMRATYLHFYAAICHESIGRAIHDLSDAKVSSLLQAKESYKAAANSLPVANASRLSWDDDAMFETPNSPGTPWFQSPIRSRIAKYQCASPTLASRFQFRPARASRDLMEPSSLHIHKNLEINSFPITPPRSRPARSHRADFRQSPPQTPPSKARNSIALSSGSRLSVTFSASSFTWLHQRSTERYNDHVAEFSSMLQGNIASVENAISSVRDIQSNRQVKRLASFGANPEARAVDLRARIARLKANGWKRKRFAPERYQELCAKALAEL